MGRAEKAVGGLLWRELHPLNPSFTLTLPAFLLASLRKFFCDLLFYLTFFMLYRISQNQRNNWRSKSFKNTTTSKRTLAKS